MKICIDAGHGYYTPGKRCLKSIDPKETREWYLNSRIADTVQELLSGYEGVETMRVDDVTGETDISLQKRVAAADKAKADVYVSFHHNAGIKGGSGGGIVVFRANGSSDTSKALQEAVYRHTVERTGLKGNRATPMPLKNFYVITYTDMPAVLGEFGFMDSTTDTPIILTDEFADKTAHGITDALVEVLKLKKSTSDPEEAIEKASYMEKNGVLIVKVPVDDFIIRMVDDNKKDLGTNYANAGFFATYHENGEPFTLPVAHLVCDFDAESSWTRKYCEERGRFEEGSDVDGDEVMEDKFFFDSSKWDYQNPMYGKSVSTLTIKAGRASIEDITKLPDGLSYAVSGVPVMRDGEDCKWSSYVTKQGWDASNVRPTWHTFLGLNGDGNIYVMGMKTTTSNLISTSEAFDKFSSLEMGFTDIIKLDGGGSFILNADGHEEATSEDRRINTIICYRFPEKEPVGGGPETEEPVVDEGYEKWKKYMEMYRAELSGKPATLTSHVQEAIDRGITTGERPCDFASREEVMTMVKNAMK